MSRSPFADARMQALASTGDGTPPGCQKNEKNETALEGGPGGLGTPHVAREFISTFFKFSKF